MKISNETKVGALLVVAVVLLILGFNLLKGNALFSSDTTIYAVYHNVDGLSAANPVNVNGLKVGSVAGLQVMDQHAGAILVTLTIKSDIEIPSNSVARIVSADLLGSKAVQIDFGNANTHLQDNDTITAAVTPSLTNKLAEKLDPISAKIQSSLTMLDSVLTDVHATLNTQTQQNLRGSIASLGEIMKNFSATSAKLDKLVNSFNEFTNNINAQNQNINQILDNTQQATSAIADADLKGAIQDLDKTVTSINQMLSQLNEGKGSLGQLLNNDQLYNNLQSATYNLNLLMEDLRLNPKRYVHFSVFGRKAKPAPLPSDTTVNQ